MENEVIETRKCRPMNRKAYRALVVGLKRGENPLDLISEGEIAVEAARKIQAHVKSLRKSVPVEMAPLEASRELKNYERWSYTMASFVGLMSSLSPLLGGGLLGGSFNLALGKEKAPAKVVTVGDFFRKKSSVVRRKARIASYTAIALGTCVSVGMNGGWSRLASPLINIRAFSAFVHGMHKIENEVDQKIQIYKGDFHEPQNQPASPADNR